MKRPLQSLHPYISDDSEGSLIDVESWFAKARLQILHPYSFEAAGACRDAARGGATGGMVDTEEGLGVTHTYGLDGSEGLSFDLDFDSP